MANVNLKSTKQEIWEALEAALHEIKSLKANRPTAVIHKEEVIKETVKKVDAIVAKEPTDEIKEISETIIGHFTVLIENFNAKTMEYNEVCTALQAKKEELDNVYGISAEADTLEALITANRVKKEMLEVAYSERKTELQVEIKDLEDKKSELEYEYDNAVKEYDAKLKVDRDREKEQYDFDQKISKRNDADKWNQEKKDRENIVAEKETAVKLREEAMAAKEDDIKELQKQVAGIPDLIIKVEKAAEGKGKAIAESKAETDARILAAQIKGTQDLADARILNLEAQLKAEQEKNETLNEKLNSAYDKIESIAKATVDNKNLTDVQETLKKALSDTKSNGK